MSKVNWTVVAVIGAVALLVLMFGAGLIGARGYGGYGYGGWGMMGPWMMGGMFFMWLFPLGFLALLGLGIAWLIRAAGGTGNPNPAGYKCPSCGRAAHADWRNCPYCGSALTK